MSALSAVPLGRGGDGELDDEGRVDEMGAVIVVGVVGPGGVDDDVARPLRRGHAEVIGVVDGEAPAVDEPEVEGLEGLSGQRVADLVDGHGRVLRSRVAGRAASLGNTWPWRASTASSSTRVAVSPPWCLAIRSMLAVVAAERRQV